MLSGTMTLYGPGGGLEKASCDTENHPGGLLGVGRTGWRADSWQEVIYNGGGTGMKGAEEAEELDRERKEI